MIGAAGPVESYGPGLFRIAGAVYGRPILILPEGVVDWVAPDPARLSPADLAAVLACVPKIEVVVFGSGRRAVFLAPVQRQALRAAGLAVEMMDTGAACRGFNVLLGEGRRVAAALIPLP